MTERHTRIKASQIKSILPSDISGSNTPSSGNALVKDSSGDWFKWVELTNGVSDHGELDGLGDDDHDQYLLIDGTRAMSGSLDMSANNIYNVDTISGSAISGGRGKFSDIVLHDWKLGSSTYDSIHDWMNTTQSAGLISGGSFTDKGDGDVTIASGAGLIKTSDNALGTTKFINWGETDITPTDGEVNHVYIDYNGGTPTVNTTTTKSTITYTDKFSIGKIYQDGTTAHILEGGTQVSNLARRTQERFGAVEGFERAKGMAVSETGTRSVAITAGRFFRGLNDCTISSFDSNSGDTFSLWDKSGSTWEESTGETTLPETYDDGDGTPGSLKNNDFGVFWVYVHEDGDVHIVYGTESYNSVGLAEASSPRVGLPEKISSMGILIAQVVISESDSDGFESVHAPWGTTFTPCLITDHGELAGLGDDDHDQYLLVDGTRPMLGDLDMSGNTILNSNIQVGDASGSVFTYNQYASGLTLYDGSGSGLFIHDDGNIGIGTSYPDSLLNVKGGELWVFDDGEDPRFVIGDSPDSGKHGYIGWDSANDYLKVESNGYNGLKVNDNNVAIGNIWPDNPLSVGWGSTELFRINNSGNVGIGTNSPDHKLQVDGVISPNVDDSYDLGSSSYRWDDVWATNATIQTSDENKKEDVQSLTYGLDFVKDLNAVSFRWIDVIQEEQTETVTKQRAKTEEVEKEKTEIVYEDGKYVRKTTTETVDVPVTEEYDLYNENGEIIGTHKEVVMEDYEEVVVTQNEINNTHSRRHLGLIAQELEQVMINHGIDSQDFAPLIISDNGDYGIRYSELIPLLIKAIQDLEQRVTDLES